MKFSYFKSDSGITFSDLMFQWPICAVCNKPVDCVSIEKNPITFTHRVTVNCHGAIESVDLPEQWLIEDLKFSKAFSVKQINSLPI